MKIIISLFPTFFQLLFCKCDCEMSNSLNWNFTWLDVTNGFVFSSKNCSFDTPCWFSLRYDDKESDIRSHRCATAIFAHGRTFIIIANSSVDNLRLSWLLCSGIQVENQLFTPILRVEKKKKQQLDIDPKKKYSRRMMRKQHIFWSASPNYSKPRQISFKKFGFGPWHAGRKLFPMKKRKIGKAFKDDIMTSRKKNVFPNSMENGE